MRFTVFVVTNLPIYFKLFSHCALNAAVGYEPHQCNQNIQRTCNPLHHKGNRNSNGIQQDGHPREVIEHALAHQLKNKAEATYARGTLRQTPPPNGRLGNLLQYGKEGRRGNGRADPEG